MAGPALKFNNTLFTYQPTDVYVIPPEGSTTTVINGGEQMSMRQKGARIRLVWGRTAAPNAVLTALRTVRNNTVQHEVKITDPGNTEHTYNVMWRSDPPWSTQPFATLRQIVVELVEAP